MLPLKTKVNRTFFKNLDFFMIKGSSSIREAVTLTCAEDDVEHQRRRAAVPKQMDRTDSPVEDRHPPELATNKQDLVNEVSDAEEATEDSFNGTPGIIIEEVVPLQNNEVYESIDFSKCTDYVQCNIMDSFSDSIETSFRLPKVVADCIKAVFSEDATDTSALGANKDAALNGSTKLNRQDGRITNVVPSLEPMETKVKVNFVSTSVKEGPVKAASVVPKQGRLQLWTPEKAYKMSWLPKEEFVVVEVPNINLRSIEEFPEETLDDAVQNRPISNSKRMTTADDGKTKPCPIDESKGQDVVMDAPLTYPIQHHQVKEALEPVKNILQQQKGRYNKL